MAATGQLSARRLTFGLLRSGRFNGGSKAIIRQTILTGQGHTPNAADIRSFLPTVRRPIADPVAEHPAAGTVPVTTARNAAREDVSFLVGACRFWRVSCEARLAEHVPPHTSRRTDAPTAVMQPR